MVSPTFNAGVTEVKSVLENVSWDFPSSLAVRIRNETRLVLVPIVTYWATAMPVLQMSTCNTNIYLSHLFILQVSLAKIHIWNEKIIKLDLHDKNGGIYTYNIKSFKTNQELPPFTIDIANYPEVEVIDLR